MPLDHYDLDTPYRQARQEWDDRLGQTRVQARNWCWAFLIASSLAGALLVYQFFTLGRPSIVPIYVEVERGGDIALVTRAAVEYNPTRASKEAVVRRFLKVVRGLPSDPVLYRENLQEIYAMATPRAQTQIQTYVTAHDRLKQIGKIMVAVNVQRILPLGEHTFDARWTETTTDGTRGLTTGEQWWSGIVTLKTQRPKTEQEMLANPLGLYIDTFTASRHGGGT
jgi:type IV secretory pathway TrbF-like protein